MSNAYNIPDAAAQDYLAAIITSSDDAIISKDLNGNITSWNPGAERIFGYTASEAVGKHISLLIPADKIREEDYILGQIRQGKRIEHFETLRRAKDGRLVNISVTISPIRNASGVIVGASKVARDITNIRQAERASAYLGAIIESSDDAIISKDLNGFITSWNRSAERIFGYTADEVIGRHITIIIPPDRLHEEDQIISGLKAGSRVEHFETIRRHKDGHLVNVSLTVSPIRDNAGNIIGASKVSRDISERVRTEEALKESNQKKDEFLANMSHELRTPMNAVIGLAGLLQSLEGLPERGKKYVETLKISADNLMDLINDLLDFSKIEANSFEIESVEFNLAEQVEKVISVANVKAREKGLDLYVNFPAALNRLYLGDPLRVHQVLMNVVSNAIKFTEKGSVEVDITGTPDSTTNITIIRIKISDTGIGIPAGKTDAIFEKFTQADTSMTRKYGGSGLGLAIVKASVNKMHGGIEVESEVGVGTTFTISLPLRHTGKASSVESFSASTSPAAPVQRRDILLVEDYAPNVMVAGAMLEQFGYSYDVAHNGFEALRKFVHGQYEVILMDVQMNELDGLEATRRIRRIESEKGLNRTPVIAMTAHVREQDKDRCFEAGMDDFIPKPFEPRLLSQKVERFIRMNKELTQLEMQSRFEKNKKD
jgi:PAS domain S-box-containing protein